MDPSNAKKSNKIRDIVRLQQLLKKWKHLSKTNSANRSRSGSCTPTTTANGGSSGGGSKSIKFLRKTLSFSDSLVSTSSSSLTSTEVVPKGFLAVCVGKELKRFVIPTHHLSHQAFGILLREAEEEFGFQQEGVLKIPCEVGVFEMILKVVQEKKDDTFLLHELDLLHNTTTNATTSTSSSVVAKVL
ncbi:hypothetical protein V2J09_002997 [Rumex salicifolius]